MRLITGTREREVLNICKYSNIYWKKPGMTPNLQLNVSP